ncbi:MAG: hypothetical protein V5B30_14115 [Candidatus Accumulibacter delftensis]
MDRIEVVRQELAELRPRERCCPSTPRSAASGSVAGQLDAEYWWHNIRQPVLFEQAINAILDTASNCSSKSAPIRSCAATSTTASRNGRSRAACWRRRSALPIRPPRIWGAASQAMIAGGPVDWQLFFPATGRFVQLPSYPWQRERHWHPVTRHRPD